MTPLEAGTGKGFESFRGTGKEARSVADAPQLVIVIGLDESSAYDGSPTRYDFDLQVLRVFIRNVETRDFNLHMGILDYVATRGDKDVILPPDVEFPSDEVTLIAEELPREQNGVILETPEEFAAYAEGISTQPFSPDSRVVFALDTSGSMSRGDWGDIPSAALAILAEKHPTLETRIVFGNVEPWLSWFVDEINNYIVAHP